MAEQESTADAPDPIGWYVRVTTPEMHDQVYNTILYVVGFATPFEAENAVRRVRSTPTDSYEVLPGPVIAGRGPQPKLGEVHLLAGAV